MRPKDLFDNAVPSANSVLALELQRLAEFAGERGYVDHAMAAMLLVRRAATQSPTGFGTLLAAIDFYTGTPREIVIVGGQEGSETRPLIDAVRRHPSHNRVIVVAREASQRDTALVPLLQGRRPIDGRATAYVCRSGTCKLPVTTPEELLQQLRAP